MGARMSDRRTKRERIARLRTRLAAYKQAYADDKDLCGIIAALIDLLEDEL